jgi:hypothetical protein
MTERKIRTWKVEGVVPAEYSEENKFGRTWNVNKNLEVFAETLEQVVDAVRERYPHIVLHKVMGDRWASDVIVVGEA